MSPTVSVITPTHNRAASVLRLMAALEASNEADRAHEVIVVADGCSDDTAARVRALETPLRVTLVEQPSSGPAAARNRGAALATGDVLLFIDDDMQPAPDVVRVHAAFHAATPRGIAVGTLVPAISATGFFGIILRGWLEDMQAGPRHPGHRYTYRDLLTGLVSVPRDLFDGLGGFDASLRCHEDYEFGYRAIVAGAELRVLADSVSRNYDGTTFRKLTRRKFDEGAADVQLLAKYPELAPVLPLTRPRPGGRRAGVLARVTSLSPSAGDALARALERRMLPLYDRARLRFRWRALLEVLLDHWYWRGVVYAGGAASAIPVAALEASPIEPPLVVDIAAGLAQAEAALDAVRPQSVRVVWGREPIADIGYEPGAERLRGHHLRRVLVTRYAEQTIRAARRSGAVPAVLEPHASSAQPTGAAPPASAGAREACPA